MHQEPIIQETAPKIKPKPSPATHHTTTNSSTFTPTKYYTVYVRTQKEKYDLLSKLHRFEANNIFSAQEIILYYFLAKEKDKSMRIDEDLWPRMLAVSSKWGISSIVVDIRLVESAQV